MDKTLLAILAATLVAPFALADHTPTGPCDAGDATSLGMVPVDAPNGATYYVDNRADNGLWVYEETNGIVAPGDVRHSLQRGGSSAWVPDDADECVDDPLVVPDTLIF